MRHPDPHQDWHALSALRVTRSQSQRSTLTPLLSARFLHDADTKARWPVWDSSSSQVPLSMASPRFVEDVRTFQATPRFVEEVHNMTGRSALNSSCCYVKPSSEHGRFQDTGQGRKTLHRYHAPQAPWGRCISVPPGDDSVAPASNDSHGVVAPRISTTCVKEACNPTVGYSSTTKLESVGNLTASSTTTPRSSVGNSTASFDNATELANLRLRMADLQDRMPKLELVDNSTASVDNSSELANLRLRMADLQERMRDIKFSGRSIPASLRSALMVLERGQHILQRAVGSSKTGDEDP